jgi:hypothetical protein
LLEKIGADFLAQYAVEPATAWQNLLLALMANLKILAKSELVTAVRDLINIAKDVEDHIRKSQPDNSKQLDGDRPLPMDAIGAQWRLELPFAGSPTNAMKIRSQRKAASASKSTTSKESASSSAKTSSVTNGSEP